MYIASPTHVSKIRAESGVSGSSSPSCAVVADGFWYEAGFGVSHSERHGDPLYEKRIAFKEYPVSSMRTLIAESAFVASFVQNALHLPCSDDVPRSVHVSSCQNRLEIRVSESRF